MLPVIILAGGYAKRMYPLTKNTPKSLIKIPKIPFIEYQIDYLIKNSVTEVYFCLGVFSEKIIEYLKSKNYKNIKIKILVDGKKPLGTGGAVKKALDHIKKDCFIMYGDSLLTVNLKKILNSYHKKKSICHLVIYKNDNRYDKSNIFYQNKEILLYDKCNHNSKMKYIDYGISILSKNVFLKYSFKKYFDLADLYSLLSFKKLVSSSITKKRFYEIGSKKGLEETIKYVSSNYEFRR